MCELIDIFNCSSEEFWVNPEILSEATCISASAAKDYICTLKLNQGASDSF